MLFGHSDKIKVFKELVDGGYLSHAYLFFGDAQIGKSHFAKLLAYYLEFGKFEEVSDLLIDAAWFLPDEKGTIGIGAVRDVKKFLWQTPLRSPRRLAVIDGAEALTPEAQSALLKIVEEPPPHALLIFIAHDLQVLFPPLLSRLSKIYFPRLSKKEVEEILVGHYKVSVANAKAVALRSFGRMGRALKLLERSGKEAADGLEAELEQKIIDLRGRDIFKNSKKLVWLLDREMLLKRFNLNQNLQRKAVEYQIHHESR